MRSCRSAVETSIVVGTSTAPSLIPASIDSHSSTWLPSMTIMWVPRVTPAARSMFATRFERSDSVR